jgi:hypothetical protein
MQLRARKAGRNVDVPPTAFLQKIRGNLIEKEKQLRWV